jgi:hypothetical protein
LATISGVERILTAPEFEPLREVFPIRTANDFRDLIMLITITEDFDRRMLDSTILQDPTTGEYFFAESTGGTNDLILGNLQIETTAYLWDNAVRRTVTSYGTDRRYVNEDGTLTNNGIVLASLTMAEYSEVFRILNTDVGNFHLANSNTQNQVTNNIINYSNDYFVNHDYRSLAGIINQEYQQGNLNKYDYAVVHSTSDDPLFNYLNTLYTGGDVEYDERVVFINPSYRDGQLIGYEYYIKAGTRAVIMNNIESGEYTDGEGSNTYAAQVNTLQSAFALSPEEQIVIDNQE